MRRLRLVPRRQAGWILVLSLVAGALLAPMAALADPPSIYGPFESTKITDESGWTGNNFGTALAIHGDLLAIGAKDEEGLEFDTGAAYVYARIGPDEWIQEAKVFASDGTRSSDFGTSVALDGDWLAVGAPFEGDLGAIYIYHRTPEGLWNELQKIQPTETGMSLPRVGWGLELADDLLLANGGWVYLLDASGSWVQLDRLVPNDAFAIQGRSVGYQDGVAVFGAEGDDSFGLFSGAAYVFRQSSNGSWTQEHKLHSPTPSEGDFFGRSVSLDQDVIAVGAPLEDYGAETAGAVYTYSLQDPTRPTNIIPSPEPYSSSAFGAALDILKGTLIVGAPLWVNGPLESLVIQPTTFEGAAYVFHQVGPTWAFSGRLVPSDRDFGDRFGRSVAVESELIAVGAVKDFSLPPEPGSVYLYRASSPSFEQPLDGEGEEIGTAEKGGKRWKG